MRKIFDHHLRIFITGLLTVLPLGVTLIVLGWLAGFVGQLAGPDSLLGSLLVGIGVTVSSSRIIAYLIGTVVIAVCVYVLGILVRAGVQSSIQTIVETRIRALPVIGSIYDLSSRFVSMLDKKESADLKTMSPVWCHFGGKGGTVALALLPTHEPIQIDGRAHHVVLIPTAPLPFGGGLLFVPADWIEPAPFGVEGLTSVYMSMGVTAPAILSAKSPTPSPPTRANSPNDPLDAGNAPH